MLAWLQFKLKSSVDTIWHIQKTRRQDEVKKKIKLCRKSLLVLLSEGLIRTQSKLFEIACEHIVFKFENNFKSNMKIILAREDVVFNLSVPQITESSRRLILCFLTCVLNNRTFNFS